MTRRKSRGVIVGPVLQCCFPEKDAQGKVKLCGTPASTARFVDGVSLTFCWKHADEIDRKQAQKKGGT